MALSNFCLNNLMVFLCDIVLRYRNDSTRYASVHFNLVESPSGDPGLSSLPISAVSRSALVIAHLSQLPLVL